MSGFVPGEPAASAMEAILGAVAMDSDQTEVKNVMARLGLLVAPPAAVFPVVAPATSQQ
jgi:hypothetical protein